MTDDSCRSFKGFDERVQSSISFLSAEVIARPPEACLALEVADSAKYPADVPALLIALSCGTRTEPVGTAKTAGIFYR